MTSRSCSLLLLTGALLLSLPEAAADEPEALPPTLPGRQVVLDSTTLVRASSERAMSLSDFDAETADIVREINRKPGTWQLYLLYTAEDLPERMFHPGFAIRFPARRTPPVPEPEAEAAEREPVSEATSAPAAPARAPSMPSPAPAPR